MELYIVKSSAILACLLFFYKMWLEKENAHSFKRWYLLLSLACAFLFPLIVVQQQLVSPLGSFATPTSTPNKLSTPIQSQTSFFLIIYISGALILLVRFLVNLLSIINRVKHNEQLSGHGTLKILHDENLEPHVFLHYIFLNRFRFLEGSISHHIIQHEEIHARQLHTIDILLIEILQILFWFNPLLYLHKNCMRLNHEFLADEGALVNSDRIAYQKSLLTCSTLSGRPILAAPFHYVFIKKRLLAMKTATNYRILRFKLLTLIPFTAILFLAFTKKEVVIIDPEEVFIETLLQDTTPRAATKDQIKEYNSMATRVNKSNVLRKGDLVRLAQLYKTMSLKQRRNAEPFPVVPPPPPPPPPAPPTPPAPLQFAPPAPAAPRAPSPPLPTYSKLEKAELEREEMESLLAKERKAYEKKIAQIEKSQQAMQLHHENAIQQEIDLKSKEIIKQQIHEIEKLQQVMHQQHADNIQQEIDLKNKEKMKQQMQKFKNQLHQMQLQHENTIQQEIDLKTKEKMKQQIHEMKKVVDQLEKEKLQLKKELQKTKENKK